MLLTPESVGTLVQRGFQIWAEDGLGSGVGYRDADYISAGARIVGADEVWSCPLVLKYKAPIQSEFRHLRPGLVLAAILHAEGDELLTRGLLQADVTAYAFEFFQSEDSRFPLMRAGGSVAGVQAVNYAAYFLQSSQGGSGKLLGTWAGGSRARLLVIGSGNVGSSAADLAARMGADVCVLCSSAQSAAEYQAYASAGIEVGVNTPERLQAELQAADVVIGAILISTFDTPVMISEEMVRSMKPGTILIDATAGYGAGYIETFISETSLSTPSFVEHGVVHIKIGNLPAAVPVSAVDAVNALYPPYLERFAASVFDSAVSDPVSARGLMLSGGEIQHPELARHARELGWLDATS